MELVIPSRGADDAGTCGRGRRGIVQVSDLEDHLHVHLFRVKWLGVYGSAIV